MCVYRIGIVLTQLPKVNKTVLKYLILQMNKLQSTFEFEFTPVDGGDELIKKLNSKGEIEREEVREQSSGFMVRYRSCLEGLKNDYKLVESPPEQLIILSLARFSDNYYSMVEGKIAILALGNWQKWMAPPTIYEFFMTFVLRASISLVCPSLSGSMHLGTKGCLCDFTLDLPEARFKTLNAFVCEHCRRLLIEDGYENLADDVTNILAKEWLGKPDQPNTPANIIKKMGYNLYITRGLEPTKAEKFLNFIQEEGIKQLINIIGVILIAVLLLWLNLK